MENNAIQTGLLSQIAIVTGHNPRDDVVYKN